MTSLIVPISLLFLSCILFWFIIGGKGNWIFKLISIALSVVISFGMFKSIDSYFGYPRSANANNIPSRAKFIWGLITEPSQDNKGAIYMWLKIDDIKSNNPFDYVGQKGDPIIFKFPYTRKLHETVSKLLSIIIDQKGGEEDVMLESYDLPKAGSSGSGGYGDAISTQGGAFEVYDLPEPKLPSKG